MSVNRRKALQEALADDATLKPAKLTDPQLALRLDALRASNGSVYDRATRNQILQEAARRLRTREEDR